MLKSIVIIASGNSLTSEDVARVEDAGIEIMGINNAYQICDLAYLYACDADWWRWWSDDAKKLVMPEYTYQVEK